MEESEFWSHPEEAKTVIGEANNLKMWTLPYRELEKAYSGVSELIEEAFEIGDEGLIAEMKSELERIDKGLSDLEIKKMLSGELDDKSCYLSINAGAGGTEACDWVLMLSRMYQRYAAIKGWKSEMIDLVDGDVAGIKNITLKIEGPFAYGYLKAEIGVHRLVRISPFDSNAKRHTSFASVDVSPELTDDIDIEVRPEDIRVDTYRSSGAGGQHVNTTDSAVRITHLPTGIVVTCQNQRSQHQNKAVCFDLLKAKLYQMEVQKREAEVSKLSGEKKEIAWGNQIRNYVFQPYTLVKDTRTKFETGNIQAVMDGEIDEFINAYLKEFG